MQNFKTFKVALFEKYPFITDLEALISVGKTPLFLATTKFGDKLMVSGSTVIAVYQGTLCLRRKPYKNTFKELHRQYLLYTRLTKKVSCEHLSQLIIATKLGTLRNVWETSGRSKAKTLCWVCENSSGKGSTIHNIENLEVIPHQKVYLTALSLWGYAIPLTNKELQAFEQGKEITNGNS